MAITFQASKVSGSGHSNVKMTISKDGHELGTWYLHSDDASRLSRELLAALPNEAFLTKDNTPPDVVTIWGAEHQRSCAIWRNVTDPSACNCGAL